MAEYNLGSAKGTIALDYDESGEKDAISGLDRIEGAVKTFATVAAGALGVIGATIAGMALQGGLSRALDIQDAQKKLEGLGHTTETITTIMTNALDAVRGTAFGLGEAAGIAASAVAAGIQPGQDLERYLKLTADAATIAGVSLGEMGSIINKVTTNQRAYSTELNQLADRGIPIYQWLAKEYGVTALELRAMVEAGQVDAATYRKVIEENIGGAALAGGETARGAFKNVRAALSRLGAAFLAPAIENAPKLFQAISRAIDSFNAALKPVQEALAKRLVPLMGELTAWVDQIDFEPIIGGIISFFKAMAGGNVEGVRAAFGGLKDVFANIGPVMATLGEFAGALGQAIGSLFAAALKLAIPLANDLAAVLRWIAENAYVLAPAILIVVAAMAALRIAELLGIVRSLAALSVQAAQIISMNNLAASNRKLAGAYGIAAVGQDGLTASQNLGTVAQLRANAAAVASAAASRVAAAALWVQTAAQNALNFAVKRFPLILIITLIAGLIAAIVHLYQTNSEFAASFAPIQEAFGQMMTEMQPAIDTLMSAFGELTSTVATELMPIVSELVAAIAPLISILGAVLGPILQLVATILGAVLGPVIQVVATLLKALTPIIVLLISAITPLINLLMMVLTPVLEGLTWVLERVGEGLTWLADQITAFFESSNDGPSAAETAWNTFATTVQDILTNIQSFFQPWIDSMVAGWNVLMVVIGAIGSFFQTLFNIGVSVWTGIFNVVSAVVAWFQTNVAPLIAAVVNLVAAVFNYLWSVAVFVWNAIMAAVQGFIDWFNATVAPVIAAVVAFVIGIFNTLMGVVQTIWNTIQNAIGTAVNLAWGVIQSVFGPVVSWFSKTFDPIVAAVKKPIDEAVAFITGIKATIDAFFANAGTWLLKAGENIINGLIKGIEGALGWLTDTLNNVTAMIPKNKGPERVDKKLLEPSGRYIMQSLNDGLLAGWGQVGDTLGLMTAGIPPLFQGGPLGAGGTTNNNNRTLNYYAAENNSIESEDDLFTAMRRSKVLVPGW